MKNILFIFSGLPATGKSTLAKRIANKYNAAYLRIDTIEQELRELCNYNVESEGYRLAYRIAKDNLSVGLNVVADSCNPINLTRREWQSVAIESGCRFINIEVICSDKDEHKRRAEERKVEITEREYHQWEEKRIIIDSAGYSIESSVNELFDKIEQHLTDSKY